MEQAGKWNNRGNDGCCDGLKYNLKHSRMGNQINKTSVFQVFVQSIPQIAGVFKGKYFIKTGIIFLTLR